MKPTLQAIDDNGQVNADGRRFPITDFNYHSIAMSGYDARCTNSPCNSFRATREYFKNEAHRDFLSEAVLFTVMMVTVAAPLLSGLQAVIGLIRTMGGI